jgi:hypothetical protein
MKRSIILLAVIFTVSCQDQADYTLYQADRQLTADAQNKLKYQIIRYVGPLAPKADHINKFSPEFDNFYYQISEQHRLELYFQDEENGNIYFLITRNAPSLYDKRIAIGGVLSLNQEGGIDHYEEIFRTWKLVTEELEYKSGLLFTLMVNGEDLTEYERRNTGEEEYIEFPDEYTWFDTGERRWISSRFNTANRFRPEAEHRNAYQD